MKLKIFFFFLLFTGGVFHEAIAQQPDNVVINSVLDGEVVDKANQAPLESVSVRIKGTTNQTLSKQNGKFTLKTGQKLPYILQVTIVGYKSAEVKVSSSPIKIELEQSAQSLTDVVVVGYGTQKRSDITGSVVSVPKNNLQQTTASFDNALSGAVAGVNVIQSSGQPGASTSIKIRGGNSITGGNEPLYVLDGFIIYNDNSYANTGSDLTGPRLNVLATINPADIESVEVLKDASATAIYGSRGANGVVIITTKTGRKNHDDVTYQGTVGWQEIRKKLALLNSKQWASLRNDIATSLGAASVFTDEQISGMGEGTDWQSAALRKGIIQNHQIGISGGDSKTKYSLSGNYFNQDGILKNTGFKRFSGRFNLERSISDKFKVGLNVIAARVEQKAVPSVSGTSNLSPNTFVQILESVPLDSIYLKDGSYNYNGNYSPNIVSGVTANPIADLLETINKTATTRTLGNFLAEYKLIDGLTAKLNLGSDLLSTKQNFYAPIKTTQGLSNNGYASVGTNNVNSWQGEFTLNYDRSFSAKHFINVLAGYTTQKASGETVRTIVTNFPSDITSFNSLQSGTAGTPYSSSFVSVINSYLGRINYSYLHKYNLTASLRADGSSRFSTNHQWGYFPSLGLSWNASSEPFLRSIDHISNLKLRLSAGTTGSQEIGDYQSLSLLTPVYYALNNTVVTGFAPQNLANPNLKWEKTNQYNAGVDIGLFKNRITATADIYLKKTSDLLLNVPVATSSGYSSVLQNIGSVENKGFELAISGDVLKNGGKQFNWNAGIIFSVNKNKVTSLGDANQFFPTLPSGTLQVLNPILVRVGQPLGSFYGYVTNGIVQSNEDVSKLPKPSWITTTYQAGDRKYVDQDGSGAVTSDDRVVLGNAQPKFTYGFTNTFSYRGFDLFILLQGSYGNKIYNALAQQLEITTIYSNVLANQADRWTTTHASNDIPRATSSPVAVVTNRNIQDGSYVRIKNISFGYSFPLYFTPNHESNLRIFFSGQNLFTWTGYKGYDPEVNTYEQNNLYQGVDYGAYPSAKNYNFGAKLSF